MARRGRPPSKHNEMQRKKSAQRFLYARKEELHMSQEKIAEWLHVAKSTVVNYETGKSPVPDDVAEMLAKELGGISQYYTGLTDCTTDHDYADECEFLSNDPKEVHRDNDIPFLALCGIGYVDLNRLSSLDFYGIGTSDDLNDVIQQQQLQAREEHKSNQIYDRDTNQRFFFDDHEFDEMMDRAKIAATSAIRGFLFEQMTRDATRERKGQNGTKKNTHRESNAENHDRE